MRNNSKSRTRNLVFVGIMAALVFITSYMYIPVGELSRLHLGNIICLLGGLLFGPLVGGLSAGIGSMIFDLTNPLYVSEFWITFITKFAMGFTAGLLNHILLKKLSLKIRPWIAAVSGSLLYVILYLIKSAIMQHYVHGLAWVVVRPIIAVKAGTSLVNGAMAVIGSVLLFYALNKALNKNKA